MADPIALFKESIIGFLFLHNFGSALCRATLPAPLSRIMSFFQQPKGTGFLLFNQQEIRHEEIPNWF